MPDQGQDPNDPDQWPDPDQWLADFKSKLAAIRLPVDPSIEASLPPVPGLLGSSEDIAAIARQVNGQPDPASTVTASAAQRIAGAPPSLPYRAIPSPHAGHYATLDEAAKAAASDVPRNANAEYGAYFPERYVTQNIDLGDGYGPQPISYLDGYDYGGLYTSGNGVHVTLGPAPEHLGGWFHNHPWDFDSSINEKNLGPSAELGGDWDFINWLHRHDRPEMETYIQGPDGQLREFWLPGDKGRIVR